MESKKFVLLRKLLSALGITEEAVNDIIDWIEELLAGRTEKKELTDLPYRLRDDFLSPAERSFYLIVRNAVAEWADVCPKVSLGDLFYATPKAFGKRQSYSNRINRKHVDFLLIHKKTAVPILGIELDDKSHSQDKRQKRDQFIEQVFQKASLPLERISVKPGYNPHEISSQLLKAAGVADTSAEKVARTEQIEKPTCPKCGGEMILRTAKSGNNVGQQFWGCSNFPRCRSVLPCA
ncbi:MAG: DNA topoisomerase I [Syntrophorhabdus sp. PtaU1.Bin050]|nr:MAG: DNA topoisomerase I [Syntrophorhabdus sp. PtaU1.Bin050]